ncbi:MAG: hypothetical protein A2X28_01355 [Elusimicrobia bacterium GWA2_56_46]|nr:MAG: hypothetical protein A2X28_01355 [Elusimicrobia bacterium GWA2_56_46]OGR53804.1 MAG: hypothetical protein A2X39_06755 [Elusimicrobia bacterium GWC2_56_31]HBB68039.1 type II secretion system protein GspE [Elusimicrobiota bacterium]HBW22656.1 type II secretion system protein GspE [Elusimicrobiota bacterium]
MNGNTESRITHRIPDEILHLVSYETARRHSLVPLELRGEKLLVAMVNPGNLAALDDIRLRSGYEIETVKVSPAELAALLQKNFHDPSDHPVCPALVVEPAKDGNGSFRPEDSFAVRTVDKLFNFALIMRASDIHLEPQRHGFFVRFRVDGVLNTVHEFPKQVQAAVISRIKIMANLDISEKRLPQDGQINIEREGKNIDLRVSTLPAKYGEKIVIRILDKSGTALGLETLGLEPDMQSTFEALIESPHGIILVTGPTGSGKTTSLYSVLSKIRSPLKNIITLEDPIEYELLCGSANEMGITQVQVHPKIGLTFAAGLRSALRQDPDVIMVGEIRDKETAETAMTAAMTGHLVLSTLHTNDAPSALGRLLDMGIESYLMSATVLGVLAQRLLRVLCTSCKEKYQPPLRALKNMFPGKQNLESAVFYRAKGCPRCQGTGYLGRHGIFELLVMSDELKQLIHDGQNLEGIRKILASQGLKSLRESGMELVFKGLTTVEEVSRVVVN